MAIKGLRQQEKSLPRAGVIRLGYLTRFCQNKACRYKLAYQEQDTPKCPKCGHDMSKQSPTEAPHFILHDAPGVARVLGTETPTELRVYFPFDDIEKNFPSARTLFFSSYRSCQGDGQFISHAVNPTTGQTVVRDGVCVVPFSERAADGRTTLSHKVGDKMLCPAYGEANIYAKCAECSNTGILLVLLEAVPTTAYFQITTRSVINLQELPGQMLYVQEMIYSLTGQRRLSGVPFILRRIMKSMTYQKKDKDGNPTGRGKSEKYVLQLEVEPQFMLDLIQAQRRLANPMAQFALPAPAQPEPQPPTRYDFAEPPQWEAPADNDHAEGDWYEEPEQPEEQPEPKPEPQPAPAQPTTPTNGGNGHSKLTRPMSPEQVKTAAAVKSLKSSKPASETQLDFAASSLSKALDGDDDKRYLVTEFLFGFTSLKNATAGQCSFIIDWIGAKKENEYTPSEDALKEIDLILRQVQVEAGQADMFNQPSELDEFLGRKEEIDF